MIERRAVLARAVFVVVVLVPALAALALDALGVRGPVAVGIVLVLISPGAPVALRRALDAGGHPEFAPALHLAIVVLAVLTVPATVAILDWIYAADFKASPFDIASQVFSAQLAPLALGASLRAVRPALAARVEPSLVRCGNLLLLVLAVLLMVDLPSIVGIVGWTPLIAGITVTVFSLAIGWALARHDPGVRPAAAITAAMRNPGLALVIATLNHAPSAVTAAVVGYALGLGLTLIVFMRWVKRR